MTVVYTALLAAIESRNPVELRRYFEATALADLTEAATFIGPDRLAQAIETFPGRRNAPLADLMPASGLFPERPAGPDRPGPSTTLQVLAECARQGLGINTIVLPQELRLPSLAYYLVANALAEVARLRRVAPRLDLRYDVTKVLPTTTANTTPLTNQDYAAAAKRHDVEVAAIKAVALVESGGRTGFDADGRPKILFENHVFGRNSAQRFDKAFPHLSNHNYRLNPPYHAWPSQYGRLHEALLLAPDAALKAASWGKFQVLGENHSGWPDVRSYVAAMYVSEANHLRAFEAFCSAAGVMGALRRKDWLAFARGYNGKDQVGYDTKMADAYRRLGGR